MQTTNSYSDTVSYFSDYSLFLKGAEATCVKIATEMKKCSRLKESFALKVVDEIV